MTGAEGGRFLSWMSRDGKLVLATYGLRSFAYGFVSVILAIYLGVAGFDSFQVGLVITLVLVSGAASNILASLYADRLGRRRFLFIASILMAVSGLIYALSSNRTLLILGALSGTMSPSGGDVGSFLSLEQAMLPQSGTSARRNSIYAIYNTFGQLSQSGGTAFSAMPVVFRSAFHLSLVRSYEPMFAIYSVVAFVMAALYLTISTRMELRNVPGALKAVSKLSHESKMVITKFAAILGVDAFAGGFVIQAFFSYWFYTKFSAPLQYLALIFFVAGLFSSISLYLAGKLADRFGAINTMVFSHLPADFLLIAIPFVPTFPLAMSLYVARSLITTMDVPARQAYTMSVVNPEERTAASGITNVARSSSRSLSPSIEGYFFQFVSLTIPFLISGLIYTASDIVLYFTFRRVKEKKEEEQEAQKGSNETPGG
jgi:MFS family permease